MDEKHQIKFDFKIGNEEIGNEENKTTNESKCNIFEARFIFGVLASLIFVIHFGISMFTSTK